MVYDIRLFVYYNELQTIYQAFLTQFEQRTQYQPPILNIVPGFPHSSQVILDFCLAEQMISSIIGSLSFEQLLS